MSEVQTRWKWFSLIAVESMVNAGLLTEGKTIMLIRRSSGKLNAGVVVEIFENGIDISSGSMTYFAEYNHPSGTPSMFVVIDPPQPSISTADRKLL